MKKIRQTAWNPETSNVPSSWRNFIRLMLARLQAVSSRNMYSEQGFEALMRPELLHVFQRLLQWIQLHGGCLHLRAETTTMHFASAGHS